MRRFLSLLLLCMICFLSAPYHVEAQPAKKIHLEIKNERLPQVFKRLEKQSGYKILFTDAELNQYVVDGKVNAKNVKDAMRVIIGTKPIEYSIEGQNIIIRLKDEAKQKARVNIKKNEKITISGRVTDSRKESLPGANVLVLGKKIGTATREDGSFSIEVPANEKANVQISFIGMKTVTRSFNCQHNEGPVLIVLSDDDNQFGEVVVNGMYSRKAESFTGSVSTYKQEELKSIGNQNILQSLSSLDPSIIITDNKLSGSNPNAAMNISINGTTSINGLSDLYGSDPNLPLFILDGFETTLQRISDLSMDRVESITTLKDASATAIYGAKAANGVIVVETHKPEAGKLRFSYNGNYQIGWADLSDYNLMNAEEKLRFEKLSGYYGSLDENGEIFNDVKRQLYYSRMKDVAAGRNTYWMNEPLRTAFTHEHSINAEGGDNAFRYGITLRYKNNEGVMKNSDRNNLDGTVNLSYRVDKFHFSNQSNLNYIDISNNTVAFSDFSRANPFYAKYDANGEVNEILESYSTVTGTAYITNPLWNLGQKSFNNSNVLSFNNNFSIEYRPIDRLRIQGKMGITTSRTNSNIFKSPFETDFLETESLKKGSYSQTNANATSYDGSLLVSFGDAIGAHTYNIVGGAQLRESKMKDATFSTIGYITDQFSNPNFSNGYPENGKPSSSVSKTRSASFYLNANYAYDMKYLVDFNVRSDGSSVFGVNNPFSSTWSFGVGWNLHNEEFMKKLSPVVNYLKLRYSIGNPGNENFDAKLSSSTYSYYTTYQNMFGLSAIVSKWGNANLKWQRTLIHNIGINAQLFNSRLYLTADYSIKNTDPLLLQISQPTSTGTSSVPMNIGATKNKSLSIALNYFILKQKDLTWQVNLSYLHTRTTYNSIGNLLDKYNIEGRQNQSLLRYYDGASSTALWAVRSLGIDPMSGNEIFLKKDNTYTFAWDSSDEVVCGDSTPDAEGNIGTNIRYKGFSFGSTFRYRWGGQAQLSTLLNKVENISETELYYNQDKRALHDRWQKPGDIAKFKRIDDTSTTNMSSRFIADENTLECTSITIGYEDTKAKWLKSFGLSSITYRMYMNNIFRLSTIKEERGLDYPFQRSISASLGLRF